VMIMAGVAAIGISAGTTGILAGCGWWVAPY